MENSIEHEPRILQSFDPLILSLSKDVSNDERAQRRMDLSDLILVCRAMEVEPAELLKRLD